MLAGLADDSLGWPMTPSVHCRFGIVKQSAYVERWWFRGGFAGEEVSVPRREGDLDADWDIGPGEATGEVTGLYHAEVERPRASAAGAVWEDPVRHHGHADILREAIDGSTGERADDPVLRTQMDHHGMAEAVVLGEPWPASRASIPRPRASVPGCGGAARAPTLPGRKAPCRERTLPADATPGAKRSRSLGPRHERGGSRYPVSRLSARRPLQCRGVAAGLAAWRPFSSAKPGVADAMRSARVHRAASSRAPSPFRSRSWGDPRARYLRVG
jgi:hypothetical protein